MILSFHPCFSGDKFISCAGREVTAGDVEIIKQAATVILPQACPWDLYEAASKHCARVFPDFSTKFEYPGKVGQIELFRKTSTPHPETIIYKDSADFYQQHGQDLASYSYAWSQDQPLVLKNNWADEGHGVFFIGDETELAVVLEKVKRAEKTGPAGFIVQRYIETQARVLRVVVINTRLISYWRVGDEQAGPGCINLSQGATLDTKFRPDLQQQGIEAVKKFCGQTGINLAGIDLLFPCEAKVEPETKPLFLEINYYFGRQGLGGSEKFYELLIPEIEKWLMA